MAYQPFYELDAWKRARAFKNAVFDVVNQFPDSEKFELTSQLKRAVRSIPTNISEGHGRFTFKDQSHFCVIARGSHAEVLNHLIDAFDCGYITRDQLIELQKQWDQTGRVLNGYLTFLQSRKDNKNKVNEDKPYYSDNHSAENSSSKFIRHIDII